MAADLDTLRNRSTELGLDPGEETLQVNRDILKAAPGDPVASNRLGIVLMGLGELAEAREVLTATVEANPDNVIASRRLEELGRLDIEAAKPAPPAKRAARKVDADSPYWIKTLAHHGADWSLEPDAEGWISDVGRRKPDGTRVRRADGVPWGEPSWEIGDEIGLVLGGGTRVSVLVKVIALPEFDPELVQSVLPGGGADPEIGERWPWVTRVRGVHRVATDKAPDLADVGIDPESIRRRPRFAIDAEQHRRIVEALSAASA